MARCKPRPAAKPSTDVNQARLSNLRPYVRIHDSGNDSTGPAIAATTALETYLACRGHQVSLSARFVHEQARRLSRLKQGYSYDALVRALETYGACPESAWPYVPGESALPNGTTLAQLTKLAKPYRARLWRIRSTGEIAAALESQYPVLAGIEIDVAFDTAMSNGGTIKASTNHDQTVRGATLITLVDFDPIRKLLCFATTWGPKAGDGGFGSMTVSAAEVMLIPNQIWALSLHSAPGNEAFKWE